MSPRPCDRLADLLEGRLADHAAAEMRAHAVGCPSCSAELAAWTRFEAEIRQLHPAPPPPTQQEAYELVRLARQRQQSPRPNPLAARAWRWWLAGGGALATATAVVLLVVRPGSGPAPAPLVARAPMVAAPDRLAAAPSAPVAAPAVEGTGGAGGASGSTVASSGQVLIAKDRPTQVRLGRDRVGLKGEAELVEVAQQNTQIDLRSGTMVFVVAHRAPGEVFVVRAAGHKVQVVGTRFFVTVEGPAAVTVGVEEGAVQVSDPAGHTTPVVAGQTTSFGVQAGAPRVEPLDGDGRERMNALLGMARGGATSKAKEAARRPGSGLKEREERVAEWRAWLDAGNHDAIEQAISDYLPTAPRDVDAWWILAEARKGNRRFAPALEAYEKVESMARGQRQNDARLEAAILLQEDLGRPADAEAKLRLYLAQKARAKTREPEAILVLAKAVHDQGENAVAQELLRNLMLQHKSTPASIEARYLLQRWGSASR